MSANIVFNSSKCSLNRWEIDEIIDIIEYNHLWHIVYQAMNKDLMEDIYHDTPLASKRYYLGEYLKRATDDLIVNF